MTISMPILSLQQSIAECASRISPTKAQDLSQFANSKGMSIEFTNDSNFDIGVNVITNTIRLPIGALNYLWSATHLFITLYDAYARANEDKNQTLDTASDLATNTAIELFNWARNDLNATTLIWPTDTPSPALPHEQGDSIHLTNEIFLAALAWILHHERAHLELNHKGNSGRGAESIKKEMEADKSASKWVMEGCTDTSERQKRAFGISTGLLAMALLDNPHCQIPEVGAHPPDLERLMNNLDIANLDQDNIVYAYSLVVLQFCIAQYSSEHAKVDAEEGESVMSLEEIFRELALRYHNRHRG